jgi:hypothetical protein
MRLIWNILRALIMTVFALVILLNSELSQVPSGTSNTKNLNLDTRIGLAESLR